MAQSPLDSLQNELNRLNPDSAKIHQLLLQVDKMPSSKNKEQKIIGFWALEKSKEKKLPFLVSLSHYTLGRTFFEEGNHTAAAEHYGQCLVFAVKNNFYQHEVNTYNGLANIYKRNKQYEKAISYYNKSIEVCEENKYEKGLMYAYYNLAATLYESSPKIPFTHTSGPIAYMCRSIAIAEKHQEDNFIMQASGVVARLYGQEKKYDSAIYFLNKSEALIKKTGKEEFLVNHYYSLGIFYLPKKDYSKAVEHLQKGLTYSRKFNNPVFEYRFYNILSEAYDSLKDLPNAYLYKKLYFRLYDSLNNKEKFNLITDAENKYQKAVKDAEISKLKTEQVLKDLELEKQKAIIAGNLLEAEKSENEIRRLHTEEKIRQLELEKQKAVIAGNMLEAERKEDEIRLLSQEKILQELQLVQQSDLLAKNRLQATADSQQIQLGKQQSIIKEKQISVQKRTRNFLIGGLALLSLLSFLLYRNFLAKKKAYSQLEEKSIQIKDQALQLSKQAKQIAQFQSQMNPHFVYNALHNIQGLVLTDEKQKANKQIQSLAQLMRKTFANAEKDDIPLEEEVSYLQKYIDFEKTVLGNGLHFEINVSKEAEGALIPPMMIQPFVENAIKHAGLTRVDNPYIKVLIETENNLLSIQVKDNGTGIKKDALQQDKLSHSMSVIKSRLDLIFKGRADVNNKAVFSIKSVPDIAEGTSVKFYLPLNFSY